MIYEVTHRTTYRYDAAVTFSIGQAHQLASDVDGQVCLERSLTVSPEPEHFRERADYYGNRVALYSIREPHLELDVVSRSVIDTDARPESVPESADTPWEQLATVDETTPLEAIEFTLDSKLVRRSEELADFARLSFTPARPIGEAVTDLQHRVFEGFAFDPTATDVDTPLETVLERRKGVCQDFAHVMIGALRSIGLAARYVSGYLETVPPPGQERLVGADRTHAWVGVHLGENRWLGFDPTNDQLAGRRYITTAHGRDYSDIPPLKGVIFTESESSRLSVSVDVAPRAVSPTKAT